MKKAFIGGLSVIFATVATTAAQNRPTFPGERPEIERLQTLYDDITAVPGLGDLLSRIVFVPLPEDIPTYNQYGIASYTAEGRMSEFMAEAIDDKMDAFIAVPAIAEWVLGSGLTGDDFIGGRSKYAPFSISALVKSYYDEVFACFTAMPERDFDLKGDILGFMGIKPGGHRRMQAPFEYHFDVPVSHKAWRNFRAHYAAAQCLMDYRNNPKLNGQRLSNTDHFAMQSVPVIFAAVMAARDGYPEILPFLADIYAATIHNSRSYRMHYSYAQILEEGLEIDGMGTILRENQSGGVQILNPVAMLDKMAATWKNGDTLKTVDIGELYAMTLRKTLRDTTENKMLTFLETLMPSIGVPNADHAYRQQLLDRASLGATRLNMCVTPSVYWEQADKSYWQNRQTTGPGIPNACR